MTSNRCVTFSRGRGEMVAGTARPLVHASPQRSSRRQVNATLMPFAGLRAPSLSPSWVVNISGALMASRRAQSHMLPALAEAEAAGVRGEVPVGAVVVAADGTVLAQAGNRMRELADPTAHA